MSAEIDEQIASVGEDVIIIRGRRKIYEKQFLKLNRQVSKEEHLFNSLKCIFTENTQCRPGDLIQLPLRPLINQYYFIESKNLLIAENEKYLNYVTLKRCNAFAELILEIKNEQNYFDINSYQYAEQISYSEKFKVFVQNPLMTEDNGFNLSIDTNQLYIYTQMDTNFQKNQLVRITPISDFEVAASLIQFYRVIHINITDWQNMYEVRCRNESLAAQAA